MDTFTPNIGGEQYQKLKLATQIKLRPDTYIGAPAGATKEKTWLANLNKDNDVNCVYDNQFICSSLIGICKEVFDNASDNVERSKLEGINPGRVEIAMTENTLSVRNYGKHIPIVIHFKQKIWTPQLIFGELLTSDNYDDSIARYKIGRNGYGVKLTNIFSKIFALEIGDPVEKLTYKQTWQNGMQDVSEPIIEKYNGEAFTQVTFMPDFEYLYGDHTKNGWLESFVGMFRYRTMGMSYACGIETVFNSVVYNFPTIEELFKCHCTMTEDTKFLKWTNKTNKYDEIIVADTPGKGFTSAFVNGTPVHQGTHVNAFLNEVFSEIKEEYKNNHKKTITLKHIKKHVSVLIRIKVNHPKFDGQIKNKMLQPTEAILAKTIEIPVKLKREILKWDLDDEIRKAFSMKTKKAVEARRQKSRIRKVYEAEYAGKPGYRDKCSLILTEGDTGCTLALAGLKYFPGSIQYNGVYPLKGVVMNIDRHGAARIDNNKEISDIMKILGAEKDVDYQDPINFNKLRYTRLIFMCDTDDDGNHIQGLLFNFIYKFLRSLAPFDFALALLTPVVESHKGNEKIAFYYHKQYLDWQSRLPDLHKWDVQYYKGLGSWNDDDDQTLKKLFKNPIIIKYQVDPYTDSVLDLAFNKGRADDRKKWISNYDENQLAEITTPRPVTDFFQNEFRSFCKANVKRMIPRLMDGMKPVHRKIMYCALKKWTKGLSGKNAKVIKIPQFAGHIMEHAGYHHGEQALYSAIVGMGQCYQTGPNNIALLEKQGNHGTRRKKGKDQSPARYLYSKCAPIAHYIFRKEDEPLWEYLYDEGVRIEPKELYPIIPLCVINKVKGIATGWSTDIPPHDPFKVIEWIQQWVEELRDKKNIPENQLTIDIKSKPELVPYWKGYRGEIRRIKAEPYECFLSFGEFRYQHHVTVVTELPVGRSIDNYKAFLMKNEQLYNENNEKSILRTAEQFLPPPQIGFRIHGMFNPTLERLRLVETISLKNMVLIDKDSNPKHFSYIFEILCNWCSDRLKIYEKRKIYLIDSLILKLKSVTLRYMFVMDVVEGRLILKNKDKETQIIPYMKSKGYPYIGNDSFLRMPISSITKNKLDKLREEIGDINEKLEYYKIVWHGDLWLKDLEELIPHLTRLYNK